ncbi:MAG: hypothetical protein AAF391_09380, partial [Bacteroidota bacterium]
MKSILTLILLLVAKIGFGQNHINTNSGSDPFFVSRNTGSMETFKLSVQDRTGSMEYLQDETSGNHDFKFNIASQTTGNLQYNWMMNNVNVFTINKNKSFLFNASDPDNAGLRLFFGENTNNNGADVDLTIDTNSGSPNVDWFIRNWGGSYTFNRGQNNGSGGTIRKELFRIEGSGNIGIGTPEPSSKLHIVGNSSQYPNNKVVRIIANGESPDYKDHVV